MIQNSSTSSFSLGRYFKAIGVPEDLSLKPSIETLFFIVNKHVMNIPYGNFVFYLKEQKIVSLSPANLQERTLEQKEGAMCFEEAELMYQALNAIGFSVKRIATITLNGGPFFPERPRSHIVLLVKIDDESYLVDVGYGYNSLRYPLKFSFEKTEEKVVNDYEKYQLVVNPDYYQLNMWIKEEWSSFYRFNNPINFTDDDDLNNRYKDLLEYPGIHPIRDEYVKCGKLTENGRIGFHFEPFNPKFTAQKIVYHKNSSSKTIIEDYKTLKTLIEESLEIKVPSEDELKNR